MMTSGNETSLIQSAAGGDRQAFGELVLHHQAQVRAYISRFLYNAEEVFDVAQDVFLEAYRCLSRFDIRLDFGRWLRGIAINLVREHLRRQSRARARELRVFEDTLRRWQSEQLSPDDAREDRFLLLRQCMESLDRESRALIEKHYVEGLALDILAEQLRKSAGALAMQFLRIRAGLAQCIRGKLESTT